MGLACRRGDTYIACLTECQCFKLLLALLGGVWAAMIVRGGIPEMFYMGVFIILSQILLAKYLFRNNRAGLDEAHGITRELASGFVLLRR
jgi:hypothetical protein